MLLLNEKLVPAVPTRQIKILAYHHARGMRA